MSVPQPLIVIPGDLDQERGYTVGKWRQYTNYSCIYCKYSTLWLQGKSGMLAHIAAGDHPWAYYDKEEEPERSLTDDPDY